ncbi:MAG: hypothetical protein GY896_18440 [Gammaproteobacteria bacterium]|nr:hypothetical protein [Gammaproteobacteria bacterium]
MAMWTGAIWFIVRFFIQELAVMRKNITIVLLFLTFLVPTVSHAARDYSSYQTNDLIGDVYLGVKYSRIGIFSDDLDDGDKSDSRNVGFMFGKGINDLLSWEIAYNSNVTKEDDWLGAGLNVEAETLGFFLVAKTQGDIYFKGRVGYSRVTEDLSAIGEFNSYGIAYGVGAGFKIGKIGAIEVELSKLPTENLDLDVPGFGPISFDVEAEMVSVAYVWAFE